MATRIQLAQSPEEFAACARQRYRVYTEEMNLYQDSADRQGQQLSDPDDAWSRFYFAEVDGEVVAGVVVDVAKQVVYAGHRGGAATRNGRPIAVRGP
ncbi:MAG TPA: hypothetical protein VGE22_13750, partial [Solimonas sp.]